MGYLLDTHTLLWYLDNDMFLLKSAYKIISNNDSQCYVSYVSFYEISIKANIKKLELKNTIADYKEALIKNGFLILEIKASHLNYYINLPKFDNHKDPFDKLLITTAATENLSIITKDEKFNNYKNIVTAIW
jgi:PIN domain nuclease of toxin-antitoxin system